MENLKQERILIMEEGHKGKESSVTVMELHLQMFSEKTKMSVSVYAVFASHTGLVQTWGSGFGTCSRLWSLWIPHERCSFCTVNCLFLLPFVLPFYQLTEVQAAAFWTRKNNSWGKSRKVPYGLGG